MVKTILIKNANIQIYEPPVDILVPAEITAQVQYEVQDNTIFGLMGNSMPENTISDTVELGVLKALSRTFPSGLSMAQVQNPPSEIGDAVLTDVKDKLLRYYGIVFTSVVIEEIKPEIPDFVSAMLSMEKPAGEVISDDSWRCPLCSHKNSGKFCTECGTKKP